MPQKKNISLKPNITSRQQLHFTPEKGWINDPNGLIYVNGNYHIFYQHYPDDTKWGPMHWGHAITRDLLHFEHLPIALFPSEDEYIFSGSAIMDCDNVSGLGDGIHIPMLLFYTGHNPRTGEQVQCLAYSLDYVNFKKYEGNPIIANPAYEDGRKNPQYKKDFRDPKVFENEVIGGYTMVVAAGDKIEFYHTTNFLDWNYTGEFSPVKAGFDGMCECPDLLCLDVVAQNDEAEIIETEIVKAENVEAANVKKDRKYVLTMSLVVTENCRREGNGNPEENGVKQERHIMPYFVGEFDGMTFLLDQNDGNLCNGKSVVAQNYGSARLLDYGEDDYAMVSFSGCDNVIMMGWGEDWNYARQEHNGSYFGKLTVAKIMTLEKIGAEFILKQAPIFQCENNDMDTGQEKLSLPVGASIMFHNILKIENQGRHLCIDDRQIKRAAQGDCKVTIIYDRGYYELFDDDGIICYSRDIKRGSSTQL